MAFLYRYISRKGSGGEKAGNDKTRGASATKGKFNCRRSAVHGLVLISQPHLRHEGVQFFSIFHAWGQLHT